MSAASDAGTTSGVRKTPRWRAAAPHDGRAAIDDPLTGRVTPRAADPMRRVYCVLALMGVLLGGVGGMLSWLRPAPAPTFVAAWVTQYQSRLLPPMESDGDQRELRQAGLFPRDTDDTFPDQERALLVQNLESLRSLRPGRPLVVYLSALAATDASGRVYVVPADADPYAPADRLPLADVLTAVRASPARYVLLILDVMSSGLADPRLGVLLEDVPARIEAELKAVPHDRRLTLCACSPGQDSHAPLVMGRTLFGYYFQAGWSGWADGCNPSNERNGQVSAFELAAFVRARVDRWSRQNLGQRQTPVLYGDADPSLDFHVFAPPHGAPPPYPPTPPPRLWKTTAAPAAAPVGEASTAT
ncbi:MAG: hypothetical protein ACRDD1_10320, partial [Planctomycetia bacterium]